MKRGGTWEVHLNIIYNYLIKETEIHEQDQRFMQIFGLKSWREETDLSEAVVLV